MARKRQAPPPKDYFSALQRMFEVQTDILTAVLPHAGERGRNDEERFKEFLRRTLPHRFSLGTGFIVSSDPAIPPSSQTDIVIYDEFLNSPLHRELAAFVYPIEIVYGTVEVKGLLKSSDLSKCLKDIAKIRALATAKRYVVYASVPVDKANPAKRILAIKELCSDLAPRSFIVAYDVKGWSSLKAFVGSWKRALSKNRDAHLHGIAVLSKDWFVYQVAHKPDEIKLKAFADHALARLVNQLAVSLSGIEVRPAAMHRYFQLDKTSNKPIETGVGKRASPAPSAARGRR